jgi:hypothetical protein
VTRSNVPSPFLLLLAAIAVIASSAALARAETKAPTADAAAARRLAAPGQVSPADGARVQAMPSFSWKPVRGAVRYEFQLSADPNFKSIVLGQGNGSYQTPNTFASVNKAVANGSYYWRVRAIDSRDRVGRWSRVWSIDKDWTDAPQLLGPVNGESVSYPRTPLVLRWQPVPNAFKYVVRIATDPSLAHSALGDHVHDVETSGTAFALPWALAPGRYYWAVTPLDAEKHPGARSGVGSFDWVWPTATATRVTDLNTDPRVFDPQFSWDPVPGAASYEVEVNPSQDFAVGSRVCCDETATGTSLSPLKLLPNNTYYWRVRAIDVDGNAGSWNLGPQFTKTFDDVTPTIPGLRVRDNVADTQPAIGPSGLPTTGAPIVAWDPVPGASSYELTVAPWDSPGFCNWTATSGIGVPKARTFRTASTAWTPLGQTSRRPVGNAFTTVAIDSGWFLWDDTNYCVRVRARSDRDAKNKEIVSEWTQLGGVGNAAFTYHPEPLASCAPTAMPASAYREPQHGTVSTRAPLFTWDWVDGACGYFVVVARDPDFTKIVDVAFTNHPEYAPRTGNAMTTYSDETTSYYWAVMPTAEGNGNGLSTEPLQDNPESFEKRSVPPALLSPAPGSDVPTTPSFRWTAAEGAREYRIQIDDDPTFGDPIADVLTDATAYTSTAALPADTALYWRVRANDENRTGLTWSETRTFRRRLPVPATSPLNPFGGETIPVLSWFPVEGAVSYDMHVEQANGTKRDFTMRSTSFTPIIFYGTGVWQWQVRANFKSGSQVVSGGYSPFVPFARRIATPTGLKTSRARGGIQLSWDPAPMAYRYKVQISTSDSFSQVVEQVETDNTSFAPKMLRPAYTSGEALYWRVATLDEGHNLGGWAATPLRNPQAMKLRVRGSLRRGRAGVIRATVMNTRGRTMKGVRVSVAGLGVRTRPRLTSRRGTASLRLRPMRRGVLEVVAEMRGYVTAVAKLRVR